MASSLRELTDNELIKKGIAPVKRLYWKPAAAREEVAAVGSAQAQDSAAPVEKKSKRQARKVRCHGDRPGNLSWVPLVSA